MAKIADEYFIVDPFRVIEDGFDSTYSEVAESVFSLGSEYMGIRGFFDEGYSGDSLTGSYFNGIYETRKVASGGYKGISRTTEYMVNSVNWLYTRIYADGEQLDLAKCDFDDFERVLDLRTGLLTRSFIWTTLSGKKLKLGFERLISMRRSSVGAQRIKITSVDFDGKIEIVSGLDFSEKHVSVGECLWSCSDIISSADELAITGETSSTAQRVCSQARLALECEAACERLDAERTAAVRFSFDLGEGQNTEFTKLVSNTLRRSGDDDTFAARCSNAAAELMTLDYDELKADNAAWWGDVWEHSDITIDGDEYNQQGIRFCIFQMFQTYHGAESGNNIGAKGLTGESYSGNAFWDTEVYCLPFYAFNNVQAARSLLDFRYRTLPQAMKRAEDLDCEGAFYPIATISGDECCNLWQHASLQLQASTAVVYAIWFYEKVTGDRSYMLSGGIEIMLAVCRMLATRGAWSNDGRSYGYYCVMGPDEFQMMVNNNCYTNYLAKFSFDYTLESLEKLSKEHPDVYARLDVTADECEKWRAMSAAMRISYNEDTMLFEQHDGYYDLPHVDIDSIPTHEFPLYHNWSYDRIYRNDMLKQPDVLMFMLMFSGSFSDEQLRANYEFYEPRCIHESSLSPSVHSIIASRIGKHEEAYEFFRFATRLDLDNYNRNTREGLHTTSIAAAWMNIVYGFGGVCPEGDLISFRPSIPANWKGYSFRIGFGGDVVIVHVTSDSVTMKTAFGGSVRVKVYGEECDITADPKVFTIPDCCRG